MATIWKETEFNWLERLSCAASLVMLLVGVVSAKEVTFQPEARDGKSFVYLDGVPMKRIGGIDSIYIVNESSLVMLRSEAVSIVDTANQHGLNIPPRGLSGWQDRTVNFLHADSRSEVLSKFLFREQCYSGAMFINGGLAQWLTELLLPIYGLEKLGLFEGIRKHLSLDIYIPRYGMSDVLDRDSQFQMRSPFVVKLEGASYQQTESNPRTRRYLQLLSRYFYAVFGSVSAYPCRFGRLCDLDGLLAGVPSIDTHGKEHSNTNPKHSRIAGVAALLVGFLLTAAGCWRLQFTYPPRGRWFNALLNGLGRVVLIWLAWSFIGWGLSIVDRAILHASSPPFFA